MNNVPPSFPARLNPAGIAQALAEEISGSDSLVHCILVVLRIVKPVYFRKTSRFYGHGICLTQAESFLRPLARRALITLQPALVRILTRKPCCRFLFNLLG